MSDVTAETPSGEIVTIVEGTEQPVPVQKVQVGRLLHSSALSDAENAALGGSPGITPRRNGIKRPNRSIAPPQS